MAQRTLGAGVVVGGEAVAGLVVVRLDARRLYPGLVTGDGVRPDRVDRGGLATLVLVWLRRFELARYSAALAVAGVADVLPGRARRLQALYLRRWLRE
ncbi:hypothetical protein ACLFMI_11205 [Pseudonocardia nantongensis]|uniref:hypothetical protein n=1 Tax=Pseudonocardia nantongensis TaxID=1181885 RepID=UPI003978F185